MIYPLPCLKTQLSIMYKRPGFEDLLKKWTNRNDIPGIMSDIYNGKIWKTFPSSLNILNVIQFFELETADRHLGIMINLDLFQPFKSAVPMKKDRTENIQKTYKKCAPYGNCTEIVQKIYKKCAKFCNSSLVETGSLFELLQILAHFLYIFCTISVQFLYGAHFLYIFCIFSYVFCMFSVQSFFIGPKF